MMPRRRLHPAVTEALLGHGLRPTDQTSVDLLRTQVRDLYLVEIRHLRTRVRRGDFPITEYASRVVALRTRYPLLSLPLEHWYAPAAHEPLR